MTADLLPCGMCHGLLRFENGCCCSEHRGVVVRGPVVIVSYSRIYDLESCPDWCPARRQA